MAIPETTQQRAMLGSYPLAKAGGRVLISDLPRAQQVSAIRPLLVGYGKMQWSLDEVMAHLYEWEVVLHDVLRCGRCQATEAQHCRSSQGHMRYWGLIRDAVLMYGRPVFGTLQCGGPVAWAARLERISELKDNYLRNDEIRPRAIQVETPEPARDVVEMTRRIAERFRR